MSQIIVNDEKMGLRDCRDVFSDMCTLSNSLNEPLRIALTELLYVYAIGCNELSGQDGELFCESHCKAYAELMDGIAPNTKEEDEAVDKLFINHCDGCPVYILRSYFTEGAFLYWSSGEGVEVKNETV